MSHVSDSKHSDEGDRIADRIALPALRVRLGMTEHDLAERAGLTENDVIAIEAGQAPTKPQLDALAAALDVHSKSLDVAGH